MVMVPQMSYNNINDAIENAQSGSTIIISMSMFLMENTLINLTLTAAPDATVTIVKVMVDISVLVKILVNLEI